MMVSVGEVAFSSLMTAEGRLLISCGVQTGGLELQVTAPLIWMQIRQINGLVCI
jgi:hypothetical protein